MIDNLSIKSVPRSLNILFLEISVIQSNWNLYHLILVKNTLKLNINTKMFFRSSKRKHKHRIRNSYFYNFKDFSFRAPGNSSNPSISLCWIFSFLGIEIPLMFLYIPLSMSASFPTILSVIHFTIYIHKKLTNCTTFHNHFIVTQTVFCRKGNLRKLENT